MSLTPKPPIILRTAWRPFGEIAAGITSLRRSACARGAEFVRAILARYTDRIWPWSPPNLIFRQDRPLLPEQYLHHHLHTQFAPRLNLTVLSWPARSNEAVTGGPLLPGEGVRVELQRRVQQAFLQPIESPLTKQLAGRVIAQSRRREAESAPFSGQTSRGQFQAKVNGQVAQNAFPIIPPVPRLVRRETAIGAGHTASPAAETGRLAEQDEVRAVSQRPRPPDFSIDVNRLTDQVIRAIDQRIMAQRERLGRI